MKPNTLHIKHYFYILLLSLGMYFSGQLYAPMIYRLFAYPAGKIMAAILSCPTVTNETGEIMILCPQQTIHVTPQCNGFGFFTILLAFVIVRLRTMFKLWLPAMLIVYLLALTTNAMRMMVGYYVHLVTLSIFPLQYQSGIHMGVGLMIFLFVFMGVSILVERVFRYGQ